VNVDYNTIYSSIVFKSCPPPPDLGVDGAFIALVAILGDIHTLSTVFHLLETSEHHDDDKEVGPEAKNGPKYFQNPYLPFSPENENRKVDQKLQNALDLWSQSYLVRASKDTAALFYFCKMYLALPSLQLLPIIAGYSPRTHVDRKLASHQARIVDSDLGTGSDASKNAWRILESIRQPEDLSPVWFPVVLFYASLVVWRTISLQVGSGTNGLNGSLRVLQLFKSELEQMKWPCCEAMANVLKSLMAV
jgi:hypothetical protein